ncbi:MAG TPA: 2-C-methyl-D-erythritol 2,4-cyclodiphosphate synthase [Cyclobacteriaceae bacterium]|nr:2-C-methyl-D-erythritol 2,4-cyclodiphosphate synthase [Cyclobacteriaceae bacterium]
MNIRVGMGFDVHRLEAGREFVIGGIRIKDSEKGPVGHSDADVAIHAICDALLGAANLRDIGYHFANTDNRWKDKDSKYFLSEVTKMLSDRGWKVGNVDCTICLERPKINPHVDAMRETLAPLMGVEPDAVSIKATTSEKLGFVGREEGVSASAVALIFREA